MALTLLSVGNPKTLKGQSMGYMTFILHLAPAEESGVINTCPKSTAGCRKGCLNKAGQGGMFKAGETTNNVQRARVRKTVWFARDRASFMETLADDIESAIRTAAKKGFVPVFRLNGTSDLSWEKYPVRDAKNIFELFPDVVFYDYTKVLGRRVKSIANYSLTFSRAEDNDADVDKAIAQGLNIAAVFDRVPTDYLTLPVIDGDESDLRFLDAKGVIVGLTAKGPAKKDYSGFVIRLKEVA